MKNSTNLLFIVGVIYLSLLIGFYIFQDKLIFISVLARPSTVSLDQLQIRHPHLEEVNITSEENINLNGWFIMNSELERSPLLIYFGGNAQEVSEMVDYLNIEKQFPGWSLLLVNYRGYGFSEGKPAEAYLVNDALQIYDTFANRPDIDEAKIVAMGWSLGTGVAVSLAYHRPVRGVILFSPYDSITSLAVKKIPLVPVRLLLKHPFDSLTKAHSIKVPVIAFAGSEDRIIPTQHTKLLMENWAGPSSLHVFEGKDHYFIFEVDMEWKVVNKFLEQL